MLLPAQCSPIKSNGCHGSYCKKHNCSSPCGIRKILFNVFCSTAHFTRSAWEVYTNKALTPIAPMRSQSQFSFIYPASCTNGRIISTWSGRAEQVPCGNSREWIEGSAIRASPFCCCRLVRRGREVAAVSSVTSFW